MENDAAKLLQARLIRSRGTSYGHYYFGDYYGSNYSTSGFLPSFSYSSSRLGYEPLDAQQRWTHRDDPQWDQTVETEFAYRRDNDAARPPRTWSDQRERRDRDGVDGSESFVVAASIEELAKSKNAPLRFQPVAEEEREQSVRRGQQVREARDERRTLEAEDVSPSVDAPVRNADRPIRVKLPKTSVASQPSDSLDGDNAPPKAVEGPKPDAKVEPQPRRPRGNGESAKLDPNAPQTGAKSEVTPANPKALQAGRKPGQRKGNPNAPRDDARPTDPHGSAQGEPKATAKVAPQAAPQREPKGVTPADVPQPAPQVTPRAESPRKEPKAAPTRSPKAERPKTSPKAESSAAPRSKPRPESPKTKP